MERVGNAPSKPDQRPPYRQRQHFRPTRCGRAALAGPAACEKVPELNSRPNELSAGITSTTGQRKNQNMARIWRNDRMIQDHSGSSQIGRASARMATRKLGSSRRISFLTSAFMRSLFSGCPRPRKFPPATAIRSANPPAGAPGVFPAVARCCRRPEFPVRVRFVSHSTRRSNQACAGGWANRARILRKRSRAASASIVSSSQPCSMMVNSSINPSNSEMRCVETKTVRLSGSPD